MIPVNKQVLRYEGDISEVYHLPMYEKVDIQAMIENAYARGEREITIPRGAYRLWPKEGKRGHVQFENMCDFTVNAYGVVFLYQDVHKHGILIRRSEGITVRGLSSDYEETIFTQCKIVAIDPDRQYYDMEVDEGYACFDAEDVVSADRVAGRFYGGTDGRLVPGTSPRSFALKQMELLGGRRIRFHMPVLPFENNLRIGDYFCPMRSKMTPYGINMSISESGANTFEDCTLWSSPISCIAECYSEGGSTYRNLKIVPGPKPLGATHERIISMSGDAFHLTALRKGPLIENTVFSGINDDGINIHGIYAAVDTVLSPNKLIIANHGRFDYRAGDELRIYDEELRIIDRVKVASARCITGEYKPEEPLCVKAPYATFHVYFYYEVTLERPVKAARGNWLVNASCIGEGFIFRGCTFHNITPRGALIKSSNGIVENCVFDGCSAGGVKIIPEFEWLECDYSTNVTVRNNLFRNCGFVGNYHGAAMTVDGHEAVEHHRIVIENNIFENNYNRDLHIACVQDAVIKNNTFGLQNPVCRPTGKDLAPCVYINKCDGVLLEGNIFPSEREVGFTGPEAENVTADIALSRGSWASDAIPGDQGRGGWRWQYAPIGTNEYRDYPNWIAGHVDRNGWWNGEYEDYTDGCILRLWWDTYMCPGTRSDVVKTYTCPKDGTLAVTATEPIKAGDIFDDTDGVLVRILKNDENIWPRDKEWETVAINGEILREIHTVSVKAGDKIHFRVNMNTVPTGNGTSWNPLVYYVEE